jgi:hypothetical protein
MKLHYFLLAVGRMLAISIDRLQCDKQFLSIEDLLDVCPSLQLSEPLSCIALQHVG